MRQRYGIAAVRLPSTSKVGARVMRLLPAGMKLLEEGDFRDWAQIEAWADRIGSELAPREVAAGARG